MKSASMIFAAVVLALLVVNPLAAMPPHPELVERIRSGEIAEPYYLSHRAELAARGVNSPARTQSLQELLHRSLDEDLNILAILVDFSDNGQSAPASDFNVLLFDTARGSLRHYYHEVSYGNLTLTTVNLPGALGWRRAPQNYNYYVNHQNGFGNYPRNAQRLAEDAVLLVDPVVDFSQYDNDGDGYVDALFIVHAGPGAERTGNSNHIWSHMWHMHPQNVDGVTTEIYSMEPEFWNAAGDMTCGVYAHEMGHSVFGLPDFYDYDYDSEGLGKWSLMAGGSWNGPLGATPAHPDAWCRIHMGFVEPIRVMSDLPHVSIPCVETSPVIYRLWTNGTQGQQYFLAENRQRIGYDAAIPGEGLLIYHVDDQRDGNDNQWYPGYTDAGHYQVALEQADGQWNLERNMNSGDGNDPFNAALGFRQFTRLTTPDSRSYASQDTRVGVRRVSESAEIMTAGLYVGSTQNLVFTYIPDTSAVAGATVCVPVVVEDDLASLNVTRVQCRIAFDANLVNLTPPYYNIAEGLIPAGWSVAEEHSVPGEITITALGGTALSGSGALFCLYFTVAMTADESEASPLRFSEMTFNQSTPPADTTSGSLTVIAPRLDTTPYEVDFGYIRVGRPAMSGLVIRNAGSAPLVVDSLRSVGVFTHDFTGPLTLLPDEWHPVRIRITPQELTVYRDTIRVFSNADDLPTSVPVRAEGALPYLHTHPTDLRFGNVGVGESSTLSLTLADTGYYELRIEGVSFVIGESFSVTPDQWPRLIPGRGSLILTIEFQPPAPGQFRDTLIIAHDAGENARIPLDGTGVAVDASDPTLQSIPREYYLAQNYPNPFNPTTTVAFGLPQAARVTLRVFDVTGREVAILSDGFLPAGHHSVMWSANERPSGVYFIAMQAENFTSLRKAILLK